MEKALKQSSSEVIKIVLVGPESSGKSTLAKALAIHYNTTWVPEFARAYLQQKRASTGASWDHTDLMPIALGQIQLENQSLSNANNILFCDTDLLATYVYACVYYPKMDFSLLYSAMLKHQYDLYILTDIDIPWVLDDVRVGANKRKDMFDAFEALMLKLERPYLIVSGAHSERLKCAIQRIDEIVGRSYLN